MTLAATGIIETDAMGLVKTRRLAAMQKQQRAKAGKKPSMPKDKLKLENRRRKP